MGQESGSSKNNDERNNGNMQVDEPDQGSSGSPSDQQLQPGGSSKPRLSTTRLIARLIIVMLIASVISLLTINNTWLGLIGAARIAALGLVSNAPWWQEFIEELEDRIVEAVLPGMAKRIKKHREITKTALPVIGSVIICTMLFGV